MDPEAFLAWAMGRPGGALAFGGWFDTLAVPLPREPDQIGDTVARTRNVLTDEVRRSALLRGDPAKLQVWIVRAATAATLADFRAAAGI
jgi:hypothetical protein